MTNFFLAHGVSDPATAHQQAIIALGNTVKRQALVMGFSDAFAVVGVGWCFPASRSCSRASRKAERPPPAGIEGSGAFPEIKPDSQG
jgi:hypothetical protein